MRRQIVGRIDIIGNGGVIGRHMQNILAAFNEFARALIAA
jgi:hypothetical protein